MDKTVLIRNFSRFAYLYDRYAQVQRLAAARLLGEIKEANFKKILEIGCGTGNYTLLLREKFANARIKAIDISEDMILVAKDKLKDKDIEFILADAEGIDLNDDFNLITSNACFQWFEDLEKALLKYKHRLTPGGIILFSIFGPHTFWELDFSLRHSLKKISVEARNFIDKKEIEKMLNKNFREHKLIEFRHEENLACLKELLEKIRYSGIRGANGKIFLSAKILKETERFYLNRFKQIKTTYQFFLCQGIA